MRELELNHMEPVPDNQLEKHFGTLLFTAPRGDQRGEQYDQAAHRV